MPPADLKRLTPAPAQIDDATVAQARKVDQTSANVANYDPHALQAFEHFAELAGDGATGSLRRFTATVRMHLAIRAQLPLFGSRALLSVSQGFGQPLRFAQESIDFGQ
jgi:hypothetical protein